MAWFEDGWFNSRWFESNMTKFNPQIWNPEVFDPDVWDFGDYDVLSLPLTIRRAASILGYGNATMYEIFARHLVGHTRMDCHWGPNYSVPSTKIPTQNRPICRLSAMLGAGNDIGYYIWTAVAITAAYYETNGFYGVPTKTNMSFQPAALHLENYWTGLGSDYALDADTGKIPLYLHTADTDGGSGDRMYWRNDIYSSNYTYLNYTEEKLLEYLYGTADGQPYGWGYRSDGEPSWVLFNYPVNKKILFNVDVFLPHGVPYDMLAGKGARESGYGANAYDNDTAAAAFEIAMDAFYNRIIVPFECRMMGNISSGRWDLAAKAPWGTATKRPTYFFQKYLYGALTESMFSDDYTFHHADYTGQYTDSVIENVMEYVSVIAAKSGPMMLSVSSGSLVPFVMMSPSGDTTYTIAGNKLTITNDPPAYNLAAYDTISDLVTAINARGIITAKKFGDSGEPGTCTRWIDGVSPLQIAETKLSVTFNTTTNKVLYTAHGLTDDTPVWFVSNVYVPGGLTAYTVYYVVNATADDFQVAATVAGDPIDLTYTGILYNYCYVPRVIQSALYTSDITSPTFSTTPRPCLITGLSVALLSGVPSTSKLYIIPRNGNNAQYSHDYQNIQSVLGEPVGDNFPVDSLTEQATWLTAHTCPEATNPHVFYREYTNGIVFFNWEAAETVTIEASNYGVSHWYALHDNIASYKTLLVSGYTCNAKTSITLPPHQGNIVLYGVS